MTNDQLFSTLGAVKFRKLSQAKLILRRSVRQQLLILFTVLFYYFSGASHICKNTFFPMDYSLFPIPKKRLTLGFLQN